jgi:large subunit ribosomal protein L15
MKLNEIRDLPGARAPRMRVGRGIGSGKGKTAGRGTKGQKARRGVGGIRQFEGGQMPLYMRLPKRGFRKPNRAEYAEVNLGALQRAVDAGLLRPGGKIDAEALVAAGIIRRPLDGVRLLGQGVLTAKLELEVVYATASARAAVEKAGGAVAMTRPARPSPPIPEKKSGARTKPAEE